MRIHPITVPDIYFEVRAMVDAEFDHFEINNDFERASREVETSNFYHDTLNDEE